MTRPETKSTDRSGRKSETPAAPAVEIPSLANPPSTIEPDLEQLPESTANALKILQQRYNESNIDPASFYEVVKLAPTEGQLCNGARLQIRQDILDLCLGALNTIAATNLEAAALLVSKLRFIAHDKQATIIDKLQSNDLAAASQELDEIIISTHPGSQNQAYAALLTKYCSSIKDTEIFKDALLTDAVLYNRAPAHFTKSDLQIRREVMAHLEQTEDRASPVFQYNLWALARELYYRENGVYLSDSEMLGVLMMCHHGAHLIEGNTQAKLLTGYTDPSNHTTAMLVLMAAFKAITIRGQEIDIFVAESAEARKLADTHSAFFTCLGLSSGSTKSVSKIGRDQITFTTIDELTEGTVLAARAGRRVIDRSDRLAFIDGGAILLGKHVGYSIDLPPKKHLLTDTIKRYVESSEAPNVDEFKSNNPQFTQLPKRLIADAIGLVQGRKDLGLPDIKRQQQQIFSPHSIFRSQVMRGYKGITHLTAAPPASGYEYLFQQISGESWGELTLPNKGSRVEYPDSVRLTNSNAQKMESLITIASEAWQAGNQILLIVSEDPDSVAKLHRKVGIPDIPGDQSNASDQRTEILLSRPEAAARWRVDPQLWGDNQASVSILIADYIQNPEVLQRIKEIGTRNGIEIKEIVHLISFEELEGLGMEDFFSDILSNAPEHYGSKQLKQSISLVREAQSFLTDFIHCLEQEKLLLIQRALLQYEEERSLPEGSLSQMPGLATRIFDELTEIGRDDDNQSLVTPMTPVEYGPFLIFLQNIFRTE